MSFTSPVPELITVSGQTIIDGTQYVYGTARETIISSGGSQFVSGSAIITTISAGGYQSVYSGGVATDTTITGTNASQYVSNGSSYNAVINTGGKQSIGWDGYANATSVFKNGVQYVSNHGVASNTNIKSGGKQILYGGISYDAVVSKGGIQTLDWGNASNTKVRQGGSQLILHSGSFDAVVSSGGSQIVSGGSSLRTTVSAGGIQEVKGGSAYETVLHGKQNVTAGATFRNKISAGGQQILSGGWDSATTIFDAGSQTVCGGSAYDTQISAGGVQRIKDSGIVRNDSGTTTIFADGKQIVGVMGEAYNVHVSKGGAQHVRSAGYTYATVISANGSMRVSSGGLSNETYVLNKGLAQIVGGEAKYTHILDHGVEEVKNAGKVKGTSISMTVSEGGAQKVWGIASDGTINGGGTQTVFNGGLAKGTEVKGKQILSSGGKASSVKIYLDASQSVLKGATSISATVEEGGVQIVAGSAEGTKLYAKGTLRVQKGGVTKGIVIYGGNQIISAGGKDNSATIDGSYNSRGLQTILKGGRATNAVIGYSGRQLVKGSAVKTIVSGGELRVSDGGRSVNAVVSSGSMTVFDGGIASATRISGGGSLIVSAGGSALDTKLIYGNQTVRGVASNVTLHTDGYLSVVKGGRVYGLTLTSGFNVRNNTVVRGEWSTSACSNLVNKGSIDSWRLGSDVTMTLKDGFVLRRSTAVAAKGVVIGGTTNKRVSLAEGIVLTAESNANMTDLHLNVSSGSFFATGVGNAIGSLQTVAASTVSYDVTGVAATKKAIMLRAVTKSSLAKGTLSISVKKAQGIGVYELSKNIVQDTGRAYTVSLGATKLGTVKLNSTALTKNGVTYSLNSSGNQVNLTVAMNGNAKTPICKGTTKAETLTGTAQSDVFYGGKGNDTIKSSNGRDVAVYDKTAWGKDKIVKTNGTMTLLFKDLKKDDIVKTLSGTTMTITKANDVKQVISIQGWSSDTHNIVFGSKMTAFDNYLKATSPNASVTNKARNEVWKKAGLASAS